MYVFSLVTWGLLVRDSFVVLIINLIILNIYILTLQIIIKIMKKINEVRNGFK